MRTQVIGFKSLVKNFFIASVLVLLGTACTKSDDISCPECTDIVIDDTPILELSQPDSTQIVIDDTLIL